MKKIIIANWKMNHAFDEVDIWLDGFFKSLAGQYERMRNIEKVLCPPSPLLDYIDSELMDDGFQHLEAIMKHENRKFEEFSPEELNEIVVKERPLRLGAQNCHHELSGSFTGDISASILKKVGCEYVILGHSERRTMHFESNETVSRKIKTAVGQHLTPIICVGESQDVRDAGKHLEFVQQQVLQTIPTEVQFGNLIIAYEPIWSIGSGITPTKGQIAEMVQFIKQIFAEKFVGRAEQYSVIYGGSVTSENSGEILAIDGVDGLLVGKASLDADEFVKICLS